MYIETWESQGSKIFKWSNLKCEWNKSLHENFNKSGRNTNNFIEGLKHRQRRRGNTHVLYQECYFTYFSMNFLWNSERRVSLTKRFSFRDSSTPFAQFLKTTSSSHLKMKQTVKHFFLYRSQQWWAQQAYFKCVCVCLMSMWVKTISVCVCRHLIAGH